MSHCASRAQFVESMKREYSHFIETSKVEQELFRSQHVNEYERLQREYEKSKLVQYNDKRQMLREQQTLVQSMLRQFDEYR